MHLLQLIHTSNLTTLLLTLNNFRATTKFIPSCDTRLINLFAQYITRYIRLLVSARAVSRLPGQIARAALAVPLE